MIWIDILFAILIAILVTALFYGIFQRAPWGSYWFLFFVILLGALAAGIWVEPVGAPIYGFYWLPGAIVALVFALLIATTMPGKKNRHAEKGFRNNENYPDKPGLNPRDEDPKRDYVNTDSRTQATVSGVFWLLLVLLFVLVLIGYFV